MTLSPQPESPEPLKVAAYLVTGLRSGEPSLCFDDERDDCGDEDHTPVFEEMVLKSDAEAAIQAARNEAEAMRADAERYLVIRDAGPNLKLYSYEDPSDICSGDWHYKPSHEEVDAWCDAAMKGDAHG